MKCKSCNTEITLWEGIKQPTPFRFTCSECGARFRVFAPGLKEICFGVLVLFSGMGIGLWYGTREFGAPFAIPFFLLMGSLGLLLEVWSHHYLAKYGTFTRIDPHHHTLHENASQR